MGLFLGEAHGPRSGRLRFSEATVVEVPAVPAGQEMAAGDLSYLSCLSCCLLCFLCFLCVVFLFLLVNLRVYDCDDDGDDEDEDEWPFITTFIIVIITLRKRLFQTISPHFFQVCGLVLMSAPETTWSSPTAAAMLQIPGLIGASWRKQRRSL